MRSLSIVSAALSLLSLPSATATDTEPVYAIAHRVLDVKGIEAALADQANAVEIDTTAWSQGWWADHDGTSSSYGDTMRTMFEAIADKAQNGQAFAFVWLDLKNPDYCPDASSACSIEALRDMARELLEPVGVRVLYGFYSSDAQRAYNVICDDLRPNEAVGLDGPVDEALATFESNGPRDIRQRIYSRGLVSWDYANMLSNFGYPSRETIFGELQTAKESGQFGQVYGWTFHSGYQAAWGPDNYLAYLNVTINTARVDGLICGRATASYADDDASAWGIKWLTSFVQEEGQDRRLVEDGEYPW